MSPTFLNIKGYRIFVWSKEEERKHVHVIKDNNQCKYWLEPVIELAENKGFKEKELNEIKKIIENNEEKFNKQWDEHFR
ncbi:hypothetical protein FACS189428_2840 [Clostridia bacterium]|nr:hypothetical protein FACS189428_2840 [Clostridia bacterium]